MLSPPVEPTFPSLQGTGLLNGRSEELLGRFTSEYPGSRSSQASICIATKLAPYPWRVTAKQFVAACRWALAVQVSRQVCGMAAAGVPADPDGVHKDRQAAHVLGSSVAHWHLKVNHNRTPLQLETAPWGHSGTTCVLHACCQCVLRGTESYVSSHAMEGIAKSEMTGP